MTFSLPADDAQKSAEALFRQEKLFAETVIASVPGILYLYDEAGRFLRWNHYFETVSGYSAEEIARMGPLDFFAPMEKALLAKKIKEVFTKGESSIEAGFVTKDGRSIPYFFTGRRVLFENTVCLIGVGIDLTQRAEAEAALRESERKYRELVENANSIILRWSRDGRINFLNEFGLRFFGYASEEILGRHVMGTLVPETESTSRDLRPLMGQILENPKAFEQNTNENIRRNGERVWISWTNKAVFNEDGEIREILSIGTDITERKKAEEAFLQSQERFQRVVENLTEGLLITDPTGQQLHWNAAAMKMLGFNSAEEAMVQVSDLHQVFTMTGLDGAELPFDQWPRARLLRGESFRDLDLIVRRHGTDWKRYFSFTGTITQYAGGRELAFLTVNDITLRKEHEIELERFSRLYAALSLVNQAIAHSDDRNELFRKVCRGLVEHGGFCMAWIGWLNDDGVTLDPVAAWGDKSGYLQSIRVRIDQAPEGHGPSGTAFREQRTYVCNDVRADPGTAPWRAQMYQHGIRASAAMPIRVQDKVCGTLTVYATDPGFFHGKETSLLEEATQDISFALDAFVSEERRRAAEAALSKSEASLAAAQSRARIGNWEINLARGAVTWSAEMFRIFGREPHLGAPSMEDVIKLIHPEDGEAFLVKHSLSVAEAKGHRQFFRVVHPDGTVCWIEGIADFVKDEQGKPILMVGTAQDVTAMKRASDEIRLLNATLEQKVTARTAELEAANKELEAFSYSVSHDLRAPLRAINGFTGIVLKDFAQDLPEAGRSYLERIRNGGERMGQLIDDLLAFSRLSRQSISAMSIDTARLVRSVVEELKPLMEGREIDLRIDGLPPCHGDANLLKQVWINLIANAIKYTRGRAPAVIEIGCAPEHGETVYFVQDNGAGFDMKYAGKLFGVFQRLHRASEFEGTGVGLAIVQRIVYRHGGRIWATAEKNRGARFSFTLQTQGTS